MLWFSLLSPVRSVKLVLLQHPEGNIFLFIQKGEQQKKKVILGYKTNKKNFWVLDSDSHDK